MMLPALLPLALGTLGVIAGQLEPSVELWTEPAVLVVEQGGSIQVKLRARCGGSDPSKSGIPDIETYMQKEVVSRKPGEKVLRLVKVTEWNSTSFIFHTCPNSKRVVKPIPVIVYSIPAPIMTPSRPDTWDLSCSVSGTAPLGNVTVTLRSASAVLASGTFQGPGWMQPDTVRLSHQLPVRVEDDSKNVTCEALLDVSPHGDPVRVASKPLVLNLTALPEGPCLSSPQQPALGMPFNVTCAVRPDISAANFTITADNRTFPATLGQHSHQATAVVTLNRTGSAQLVCTVSVGSVERQTDTTVQVYHVPEPLLNVTSTTPAAGTVVSGDCALPPDANKDIQLRVLAGGRVPQDWGRPPMAFRVNVSEADAELGLELSCEAKLLDVVKRTSVQIVVHTKPRLDSEGCPGQQNWTEGQEGILACKAKGKPKPEVKCSKDGNSITAGTPYPADRAQAGTYRCRATNALGTAERDVTVWVQYDDPVPLLPVLLGVLLPVLALLGLAGLYLLHHHHTKIGEYWLWKRQPVADMRLLQPLGSSKAATTHNGSAPEAP
ncbi:intercellular adhesion molecule 5-like [Corvus moneduloides]|uniref:intercellular adhesion molecule 5-like n=1 Tax=Corvus moneduloides TaxID=1196302 RepID=UPI001363D758|nr:intercellular adhesion molecule 5-like [Corvus moneduloides]